MPYKSETTHKKLPRQLDRRIKLTTEDKTIILKLFSEWETYSQIARQFGVHRSTIRLLCNPDLALKQRETFKLNRLDGRYYNKDKQLKAAQETRKHRRNNLSELI